jgi:hypothetical protein
MKRVLLVAWLVFKWSMVALGTAMALMLAWNKWGPKWSASSPTETAMVGTSGGGCVFAFQIAEGKWRPDTSAATQAMVPKDAGAPPSLFLTGTRYWSGRDETGGWDVPIARKCSIERRGSVTTKAGASAPVFLATACGTVGDYYENYAKSNLLYGYVNLGKEADFIWLASDSKAELLEREGEFRVILKSHSLTDPKCAATKK